MVKPLNKEIESLARKYSLLNAIQHEGMAEVGSVLGKILAEQPELRADAKNVRSIVLAKTLEVNELSPDAQLSALTEEYPEALETDIARKKEMSRADSEKRSSLPPLPDTVSGSFVTRFPPEPNGFMHIGHAKAAIIGSEYARLYLGKFIVRFDDTNPAAEKKEYYETFLESLNWLGIHPDTVRNSSDDMAKFYDLAERSIRLRVTYVCTCTQETMREKRNSMKECEHRGNSVEDNFTLWKKMLSGESAKSFATLRFKGDMGSVNTTMRDPVLFRIVEEPHPLKGTSFRVWPTYDFDGPVEDSLDGVTHAMRSKEYELRDELYNAILNSLGLRRPRIIEFSRLSLQNTTVSKRSLKKLIESGQVQGWDDPRLPTISGLKRRGFVPQAIRDFILSMGVSKVESEPTWDLLESINRKILDPIARRLFFVSDPVSLEVRNAPTMDVSLRNHPEKELGERVVRTDGNFLISGDDATKLREGSMMRLIELYNVKITSVAGEVLFGEYSRKENLEGIPKLQWVSEHAKTDVSVLEPGPLLLNGQFNDQSLRTIKGIAERALGTLPVGEIVQFVRFGFCRIDSHGVVILTHK